MRLTRKSKLILAGIATIAITGGSAIAYWTTSGTGSGSATVGTSTAVTVVQTGTIAALTPGSTPQAINFTITNPAATNQTISSVAISITGVTGPNITGSLPCTAADFDLVQPNATYGDLTPGAHPYSPSGATLQLLNTASNQDGCKNATVALSIVAS
jgi:hypothetical protein